MIDKPQRRFRVGDIVRFRHKDPDIPTDSFEVTAVGYGYDPANEPYISLSKGCYYGEGAFDLVTGAFEALVEKTWNQAYPDRRPWKDIPHEAQQEWLRVFSIFTPLYDKIK